MRACIADLRWWAAEERRRAAAAAALAARYEQQAAQPSPFLAAGGWPERAAIQRRAEACHRGAARLHERHAARLQAQLDTAGDTAPGPGFASATLAALGLPSTAIVLLGEQRAIAVVAASDATARAAHDLEILMGEGPVHALTGKSTPVLVAGPALCDRWPGYGPAVTELGVQAVLAVPLPPAGSLGALCAYTRQPAITDDAAAAAGRIAAALARALLQVPYLRGNGDSALRRLGLADDQAVVHQAAGMVSAHCHCSTGDALALLRARAFADGQPVGQVAHAVVHHGLRLD